MNKYFIILLSILSFQLSAQINNGNFNVWSYKDSISGGEANISLDKKLEKIIKDKEESECLNEALKPPRELTPDEKCARQQKIMGYKIQIFYTKDRSAAEKVRDDFGKRFPNLTPELIYASPDYRVLVGDYFTRTSASDDLKELEEFIQVLLLYNGGFGVGKLFKLNYDSTKKLLKINSFSIAF